MASDVITSEAIRFCLTNFMRTTWFQRLLARLRGRDLEAEYWTWVLQHGRITEGQILEIHQASESEASVSYSYKMANVTYEAMHQLTPEQLAQPKNYTPGKRVTVRFDSKNPSAALIE
jgi:hypothetical protein